MFRKIHWPASLKAAITSAFLFSIPAFIYIKKADFTQSWLLFLGCILFFFTMAIHTVRESGKRGGNESTVALVFESHITTVTGILAACLLSFLLLVILVPGYLHAGDTAKALINEPANSVHDKTNGLSFYTFIAATIGNFSGGSIAGITIPFYAKRNQTKDNSEPVPFQHREAELKTR